MLQLEKGKHEKGPSILLLTGNVIHLYLLHFRMIWSTLSSFTTEIAANICSIGYRGICFNQIRFKTVEIAQMRVHTVSVGNGLVAININSLDYFFITVVYCHVHQSPKLIIPHQRGYNL